MHIGTKNRPLHDMLYFRIAQFLNPVEVYASVANVSQWLWLLSRNSIIGIEHLCMFCF